MRRAGLAACAALTIGGALSGGCGDDPAAPQDAAPLPTDADVDAADPARAIVPGERVGPIALGMTWGELVDAIGEPPTEPVVLVRLGQARWPALGLEAVLTSPEDAVLTDDALVIGAGAIAAADFAGPAIPGLDRAAIEATLGVAPEQFDGRAYYPAGITVEYDRGERATKVAVVAPYTLVPEPPPMQPAATTRRPR